MKQVLQSMKDGTTGWKTFQTRLHAQVPHWYARRILWFQPAQSGW
jgi:hypothetical protein